MYSVIYHNGLNIKHNTKRQVKDISNFVTDLHLCILYAFISIVLAEYD